MLDSKKRGIQPQNCLPFLWNLLPVGTILSYLGNVDYFLMVIFSSIMILLRLQEKKCQAHNSKLRVTHLALLPWKIKYQSEKGDARFLSSL